MTAGSLGPYCTRPPFTLCPVAEAPHRPHSADIKRDAPATPSSYQHDALGNRIKEAWTDARGAIDYSYLPGNYLVQRGSTIYSWGTYGQLILKDEQPNALGGETNYDYSARRLMTQVRLQFDRKTPISGSAWRRTAAQLVGGEVRAAESVVPRL